MKEAENELANHGKVDRALYNKQLPPYKLYYSYFREGSMKPEVYSKYRITNNNHPGLPDEAFLMTHFACAPTDTARIFKILHYKEKSGTF